MKQGLRRILGNIQSQLISRLLQQLDPLLTKVGPNWARLTIKFDQYPGEADGHDECDGINNYRERESSYQSVPSFVAKPVRIFVNGPQGGDVELPLDKALDAIEPQLLVTLMTLRYQLGAYTCETIEIANAEHKFEVIPGVTYLSYENVCDGFVLKGNAAEFLVTKGSFESPYAVARYSEARVVKELAEHDDYIYGECRGQVVSYGYLPKRFDYRGDALQEARLPIDTNSLFCQELITLLPDGKDRISVEYDEE